MTLVAELSVISLRTHQF